MTTDHGFPNGATRLDELTFEDRWAWLQQRDLTGRTARCAYCKTERPSDRGLAFFEYRGPGYGGCSDCGFKACAHLDQYEVNPVTGRPNTLQEGRGPCGRFRDDGLLFDGWYCGCRGWD